MLHLSVSLKSVWYEQQVSGVTKFFLFVFRVEQQRILFPLHVLTVFDSFGFILLACVGHLLEFSGFRSERSGL